MNARILNTVLMGTFGFGIDEALGISPKSIVDRHTIAEDRKLIDRIAPHITRLTPEELDVMLSTGDYIDPMGLNPKPMPREMHLKVKAIADRFNPH